MFPFPPLSLLQHDLPWQLNQAQTLRPNSPKRTRRPRRENPKRPNQLRLRASQCNFLPLLDTAPPQGNNRSDLSPSHPARCYLQFRSGKRQKGAQPNRFLSSWSVSWRQSWQNFSFESLRPSSKLLYLVSPQSVLSSDAHAEILLSPIFVPRLEFDT